MEWKRAMACLHTGKPFAPSPEHREGDGTAEHGADSEHAGAREATSLMLAIAYFLYIPAAFSTLGTMVAGVVVALQVVSFLVILFGMLLDLIIGWPDKDILQGKAKWAACTDPCCLIPCGCALNSHGWWHIVSLISAISSPKR